MLFALTLAPVAALAATPALIDDFSDPETTSLGIDRQFITDAVAGGASSIAHRIAGGILHADGEIKPPRGQPGWASTIFLLDRLGMPQDASQWTGIRLRVKRIEGNLSISANSAEVENFDYHAAVVTCPADGAFHEIHIPFESLRRAWSEQTPLDTTTLLSVSLVAFGMRPGSFAFEVDEIAFY